MEEKRDSLLNVTVPFPPNPSVTGIFTVTVSPADCSYVLASATDGNAATSSITTNIIGKILFIIFIV